MEARPAELAEASRGQESQAAKKLGRQPWREATRLSGLLHDVGDLGNQSVTDPELDRSTLVAGCHVVDQPQKIRLGRQGLMFLCLEGYRASSLTKAWPVPPIIPKSWIVKSSKYILVMHYRQAAACSLKESGKPIERTYSIW